MVATIAVPTNAFEIPRILNNFWLWDQAAFQPGACSGDKPRLLFCFNNDDAAEHEPALREAYRATSHVQQVFEDIGFLYLGLRGEQDLYIRDYDRTPPVGGYKVGPNNQFFELVDHLSGTGDHAFLMETDCVPIRSGWLPALERLVKGSERFWIKGSPYCGRATLPIEIARHINGNAIYAVGDPSFQEFVAKVWKPSVDRFADEVDPRVAYDIYLEWALTIGLLSERPSVFRTFQEISCRLTFTEYVMNISADVDNDFFRTTDIAAFIADHPDTYLLHGGLFAKAVDCLRTAGGSPLPSRLGADMPVGEDQPEEVAPAPIEVSLDILSEDRDRMALMGRKLDDVRDELSRTNANRRADRTILDTVLEELAELRLECAAKQKVIDRLQRQLSGSDTTAG